MIKKFATNVRFGRSFDKECSFYLCVEVVDSRIESGNLNAIRPSGSIAQVIKIPMPWVHTPGLFDLGDVANVLELMSKELRDIDETFNKS